jgi:hypothetical protein
MGSLKDCDGDFKKLAALTPSHDEIKAGVRELVAADPVKYHWCFYSKVLELNGFLKNDTSYVDERQKRALDAYNFLVPVARGFMAEFQDSRYLRYSVTHYRRLSEWIFFRKLEMTPQATSELVDAANPFGLYRAPVETMSVLEKYSIPKSEPAPSGVVTGGPVATVESGPAVITEAPTGGVAEVVPTAPVAEAAPAVEPVLVAEAPTGGAETQREPAAAAVASPTPAPVAPATEPSAPPAPAR